MNKKAVKIILDVIKKNEDRAGIYGAEIVGATHEGDKSYTYFTDGYVMVRFENCLKWGLPLAEDMWVDGGQMKRWYATAKAKDIFIPQKTDFEHANMAKIWGELVGGNAELHARIDPEVFKKLAPLGFLEMSIQKKQQKIVYFKGEYVEAIAMPLKD